jgi:hypothetical protein
MLRSDTEQSADASGMSFAARDVGACTTCARVVRPLHLQPGPARATKTSREINTSRFFMFFIPLR